ncbi:MAG TPA: radical SAM protein [Candidatus Methylomirabilis sp.]|nr:radical SAM protein [Candidatus Methylomirabilis sp.]
MLNTVFVADAQLPTDQEKKATFAGAALGPKKPRAVLLNPPGTKHFFRDYFCTLVSKAKYYYHPVDLVYLSGILDRAGYHLECVDAIASNLTPDSTWSKIEAFKPDIVVYLIASPSYEEDVPFLTELKRRLPNVTFIGSGDVYREIRESGLDLHPFCDAILTDFSTHDLVDWLRRTEDRMYDNIIYRGKDGVVRAGPEKHGHGFYDMPIPRWDLWPLDGYSFPFSIEPKFATVLTDFGCPFSCVFCPMSTTGYKLRDLDTVMDELRFLRRLGINEVFFRDQTFGVNRVRTQAFLERLKTEHPDLKWTCWSRVDLVTEEFLKAIRDAGCHTVMYGIESANEEILKQYKKNTKREQMERSLGLTRQIGMRTVGTFVIGLPGESEASILDTIEYARRLPLDFASFNIATPRFGTTFRKLMKEKGAVNEDRMTYDSSKTMPSWVGETNDESSLPNEVIYRLQRRAIRRFYLRPGYLVRRLLSVRSWYELYASLREGWELVTV